MPGDVFGDGVVDDAGAEGEGVLQKRRREGIVHTYRDRMAAGDIADGLDVHDLQGGVGGRFEPDEFCVWGDRFADHLKVGHVDKSSPDAHRSVDADQLAVGAPVEVVAAEDFVTGLEELEYGIHGGEAAAVAEAVLSTFEGGETCLEGVAGWVLGAGVFVAFMLTWCGLHVRGGLEDGRHDGAGGRVGGDAGVYGAGAEAVIFVFTHGTKVMDCRGKTIFTPCVIFLSESRINRISQIARIFCLEHAISKLRPCVSARDSFCLNHGWENDE